MRVQIGLAAPDRSVVDVVVDLDEDTPAARAAAALGRVAGTPAEGLWVAGQRLDDDRPVGESALCSVLSPLTRVRLRLTVHIVPSAGTVSPKPSNGMATSEVHPSASSALATCQSTARSGSLPCPDPEHTAMYRDPALFQAS